MRNIPLIQETFFNEKLVKKKLVNFILKSKKLSMGKEVSSFENKFANFLRVKNAIMFNSGSSANLALIQSLLNLKILEKGDKVGLSALNWSTTVMPIIQLGLSPVLIDISESTLNISPDSFLKVLSKDKIKLLFLTNILGLSDNVDVISKICKKNKIIFIEDNCEALGSTNKKNQYLGTLSLGGTFSFFVGHHLSTIEGGMVVTNNFKLSEMLRLVRAHGWTRDLASPKKIMANKKNDRFYEKYTFYDLAFNLRPTEIQGFIGCQQIKYLPKIINIRNKNFIELMNVVKNNNELQSLDYSNLNNVSNFTFPVVCKSNKIALKYRKRFTDNNIEIRPLLSGNISTQPFYKKYFKIKSDYRISQKIYLNSFYIPNNPSLSKKEMKLFKLLLAK